MRNILVDQFALTHITLAQELIDLLGGSKTNLAGIVYSSLFQAGATHFEMIKSKDLPIKLDSKFLIDRSRIMETEELNECQQNLTDAFSKILPDEFSFSKISPDEFSSDDELWSRYYAPVIELIRLLTSMTVANKRHTAFVVTEKPDIEQLQLVLPPDVFVPVNNFLSSIQPLPVDVPIPAQSVASHHLSRLNEIISSDLFLDYSKRWAAIEQKEVPQKETLAKTSAAARRLYQRYADDLRLKHLIASMIPVTGKAVELVLGALPAKVFDVIGESFSNKLRGQRAICFYQFNILDDYVRSIPEVREAEDHVLDKNWRRKIRPPHAR